MEGPSSSTHVEDKVSYEDDKPAAQKEIQQYNHITTLAIKLECDDVKPIFKDENVKVEKTALVTARTVKSDMMSYVKKETPYDFNNSLKIKNETDHIYVDSIIQNTESNSQNTLKKEKPFHFIDSMVKSEFVEEDKEEIIGEGYGAQYDVGPVLLQQETDNTSYSKPDDDKKLSSLCISKGKDPHDDKQATPTDLLMALSNNNYGLLNECH